MKKRSSLKVLKIAYPIVLHIASMNRKSLMNPFVGRRLDMNDIVWLCNMLNWVQLCLRWFAYH
jgi:hypothetical protein